MIYLQLFISFFKVGLFSFGGGYAALYKMQKTLEEGYKEFSAWRENRQSGVRADGEARA